MSFNRFTPTPSLLKLVSQGTHLLLFHRSGKLFCCAQPSSEIDKFNVHKRINVFGQSWELGVSMKILNTIFGSLSKVKKSSRRHFPKSFIMQISKLVQNFNFHSEVSKKLRIIVSWLLHSSNLLAYIHCYMSEIVKYIK